MIFIIILLLIAFVVWMSVKASKIAKELKARAKEMGAVDYFTVLHIEGLGVKTKAFCNIFQLDNRVLIESEGLNFEIPSENIRAAEVKNERELIEKNKSVVGRALIGTLLVPGLGTIVGGMSGVGTKKKKGKMNTYLILNFINSKGEMDAVTFQNNFSIVRINKFCKNINTASVSSKAGKTIQL